MNLAERIEFAEETIRVADAGPFRVKGREWVRDEFWLPLVGAKLWPVSKKHLCDSCKKRTGELVESVYAAKSTLTKTHWTKKKCKGLHAHMLWLILIQLPRQSGKTAGVAAFVIAEISNHYRASIAFISGSEDQSVMLFNKDFAQSVKVSKKLDGVMSLRRTGMTCKRTGSTFDLFPTSMRGATGGSRNFIVVDEAREVPAKVFAAAVPQINARNGWRCPSAEKGHSYSNGDLMMIGDTTAVDPKDPKYGAKCDTCGDKLEPWVGRVCAMSSQQELDGGEGDWFELTCAHVEEHPSPDAHVFRSSEIVNPSVSRGVVTRTHALLGAIDGLSEHMDVEQGGVSRHKGERYMAPSDIMAVEDPSLRNRRGGIRQAVGFLDTSETSELTSFVLFEDASVAEDGEDEWYRIEQVRLDVWDPKKLDGRIINEFDVEAHVKWVLSQFAVVRFRMDERGRPWAIRMLKRLQQKDSPYRGITLGCAGKWGNAERRVAYSKMRERYLGRTISTFADRRLRKELKGAREFRRRDNEVDVHELRRRVNHLDIVECVASVCLDIHELGLRSKGVGLADTERKHGQGAGAILSRARRRSLVPKVGGSWD